MNSQKEPTLLGSALRRMERESQGRIWWHRAPLLVPLAVFYLGHVSDLSHTTLVSGTNLIIHEGGHLFFLWFGNDLLTVLGGTFFQVGVPLAVGVMFFRQKDPFAVAVAGFWLGLNLAEIAPYAADARAQLLPLVSPFPGAPKHDWNYILGSAGLLAKDQFVGRTFHHAGILVMTAGLALGVQVLRWMAASRTSEHGGLGGKAEEMAQSGAGVIVGKEMD